MAKSLFLHNIDTMTRINPVNGNFSNVDLIFSTGKLAGKVDVGVVDDT